MWIASAEQKKALWALKTISRGMIMRLVVFVGSRTDVIHVILVGRILFDLLPHNSRVGEVAALQGAAKLHCQERKYIAENYGELNEGKADGTTQEGKGASALVKARATKLIITLRKRYSMKLTERQPPYLSQYRDKASS
jgi:hypothetical protein